jgi:hypothetical protein
MKLLMLIVAEEKKEELEVFLSRAGAVAYTEIPRAIGMGATGPRLGSGAFPKTSAVIFSVIEPAALETLARDIKAYCAECGERVRAFAWDVESIL